MSVFFIYYFGNADWLVLHWSLFFATFFVEIFICQTRIHIVCFLAAGGFFCVHRTAPRKVNWSPKLVLKCKTFSPKEYDRSIIETSVKMCDNCSDPQFEFCFSCNNCDDFYLCRPCFSRRKSFHEKKHRFKRMTLE